MSENEQEFALDERPKTPKTGLSVVWENVSVIDYSRNIQRVGQAGYQMYLLRELTS